MTKLIDWFLNFIAPFVKWLGKIHFPFSRKKITGDEYYLWRDFVEPASVLLTKTGGEISNYINPTQIKHGGLYAGRDGESPICNVVEAISKGVVKTNLVKFMTTKDVFIIVSPKFGTPEQHLQVAEAVKNYVGLPYDWIFSGSNEKFYCFELIIKAYNDVFPNKIFKCKEIVKGKRIYTEETFLDDPENWQVIVDSRKYFEEKE